MLRSKLLVVGALSAVLLVVSCQLSVALDLPRFYGEEVVVTAARVPVPISASPWNTSVLNKKDLANFKTVGEALRTIAGVDSTSYGYLGSLNSTRLRGANASQVLILVDGRRINSPTLGMFDTGDLLLGDVEKIEVVRAPLSAMYGSDAVSGVINIITKTPSAAGQNLSVDFGSFGTQQYKYSFDSDRFAFAFNRVKSEGFRKNGDYAAMDVVGKFKIPAYVGELLVDYDLYVGEKGVPGVPTSEADPYSATEPNDRQTDKNAFLSVGLKGNDYLLRAYQNTFDQNLNPYIWGAAVNQTWQTAIEWQKSFGPLLWGLEAREDRGKTTNSGAHAIQNYAAFMQGETTVWDYGSLIASVRADKHTNSGISINPRVGMVYTADEATLWRLSAGTGFRAPTLNELYWNDGWMFGDANLKPEKSFSYDIGLEKKMPYDTTARLNYFCSNVTDLILWDWVSSTIETRAKNVGEARMEGVEFELVKQIGEQGKAFINYTYQKAIDRKDFDSMAVDKTLRYTPENKYNAGLVLGDCSVLLKYVGERYADAYNMVKLTPYTVVDLNLGREIGQGKVNFAVQNLFDQKYTEMVGNDPATFATRNYPMPGRQYSLSVKWVF